MTSPQIVDEYSFLALAERGEALRPGPRVAGAATVHWGRLVVGMVMAAYEKGYAATTIGDVVSHAKVSRRTFYEHFDDKESCFLAAYDTAADLVLQIITNAVTGHDDWRAQVRAGVGAYLAAMAKEPPVSRVFLVEVLGAGPRALARRRAVLERFSLLLRGLVERARLENPELKPLSPEIALAIIGGTNELVLVAVEDNRFEDIPRLEDTTVELLTGVLVRALTP